MKLVDSQFDKNDKSAEAFTARNQVLNKEIEQQKQKIETLRSALANAAESFGENDRRTQNWQMQLNNAQAALNEMERELDENEKAIKEGGKAAEESGSMFEGFGNPPVIFKPKCRDFQFFHGFPQALCNQKAFALSRRKSRL